MLDAAFLSRRGERGMVMMKEFSYTHLVFVSLYLYCISPIVFFLRLWSLFSIVIGIIIINIYNNNNKQTNNNEPAHSKSSSQKLIRVVVHEKQSRV